MLEIYAIFDAIVGSFMNPVFVNNEAEATRGFGSALLDETHSLHENMSDVALYALGTYDPDSGAIHAQQPRMVVTGQQAYRVLMRKRKQVEAIKETIADLQEDLFEAETNNES